MKKIVPFIIGPTAAGKTYLSLCLAEQIELEIVSADSRQVYRYMDIGTAKAAKSVRSKIPHHFIDICNPDEYYSAGKFSQEARQTIDDIQARNKIPVAAGGSGLYIRALIDGFFEGDLKDKDIRKNLDDELAQNGLENLYKQLQVYDPEYAQKISVNDTQRILRSLEVYKITGIPFSEWIKQESEAAGFQPLMIGLRMEREQLYKRINERVDEMLSAGLLDEVSGLQKMGYSPELNALNTVGYKEVFLYFDNKISCAEMTELIKRNSRRYAKRQMTWFKKDARIIWHDITDKDDLHHLSKKIIKEYENIWKE